MKNTLIFLAVAAALFATTTLFAGPVTFMSGDWASATCEAWNASSTLTDELAESGWAGNESGKGYKIMRIHRNDCADAPKVDLKVQLVEGKAKCISGGWAGADELSKKHDYAMWADTDRWQQMGAGEYGAMKAMLTGRLKFSGPKGEAMSNMGPFGAFLVLVGDVDADASTCPAR
jgi:putative sterol carrier protein